jgi:hypothetical protein
MGLSADTIQIIARLLREQPVAGRAITLGVQKVGGTYDELIALLDRERYPRRKLDSSEIVVDPLVSGGDRVHQDTLFRMLGFSSVHSIDYFPDEKPTHQLDLNRPVPDEMQGHYDLVCDSGTTEHCFNVPEVLANIVRLLRPGGWVVHASPITGWLMHGFYQICPSLLFHFYAENGFAGLEARVLYDGRCLDPAEYMPHRDFLGNKALLIFVARKTESGADVRWPVQFQYSSPEIERIVKGLGGGQGGASDPGRRSILSPAALTRDVGAFLKQYLRIARRARRL